MKRQLPEVVSGGRFVSGGKLEAVQGEPLPDELKLALIALLQPGETVTRCGDTFKKQIGVPVCV